ncbi:MAG: iron-sulfur cluster insertion protein ErpA [Rhizobiaceae bacterium]|nr:iron-sulfur cluster insertion protein ErpA [Rhizobiaceae bacterium]
MNIEVKSTNTVTATKSALGRVAKIVTGDADNNALRVTVEGGGCSGFSYKFDLVNEQNDDDLLIEGEGGKILIDSMSMIYMGGSEIDFVDDLMGQSFQINNPNAVASCGCGTSFSV